MKLRLELLEQVTAEEVLANNHRYKAEPLFSKTGTGRLSSASTKELADEEKRNTALIRKLTKKSQDAGKTTGNRMSDQVSLISRSRAGSGVNSRIRIQVWQHALERAAVDMIVPVQQAVVVQRPQGDR